MNIHEVRTILDITSMKSPKTFLIDNGKKRYERLSDNIDLCLYFGNDYLNRQERVVLFKDVLSKTNQEKQTLQLIDKVDESLRQNLAMYDMVSKFEKQQGKGKMLELRN